MDFFTWNEKVNSEKLLNAIKQIFSDKFSIENISQKQLDLKLSNVKVTFFANKWKELKNRKQLLNNIYIASPELLTAMKLNILFLRAKYRDYYDLYVINKKLFSISEMYEMIKKIMPQINKKLFQMALIFIDDIEEDNIDYLEPKFNVKITEIQKYFEKNLKKLNEN